MEIDLEEKKNAILTPIDRTIFADGIFSEDRSIDWR